MELILYVPFIIIVLFFCIKEANNISTPTNQSEESGLSEKEQGKPKNQGMAMIGINFIISFVMCLYDGIADGIYVFFIIGIPFIWLPLMLTGFNIRHFRNARNDIHAVQIDLITIFIGGVYHMLLLSMVGGALHGGITDKNYKEAVYPDEYHEMINSEYGAIIEWVMVIGFIAMVMLCVRKPMKTPPLQSALCIAFTAIMLLLIGIMHVQMICNFESAFIMFYLYYFNLIIISARRILYHITEQVRLANERTMIFRTKAGERLHKIMSTVSGMTKFSFMLILPIAIICEILYIVFGQGADGFIKAFTMTADWTFSTQIPPPPLEYEGHYLCTVAAGGHEKIVKPVRYGIRCNQKIVVNRQLLIANAFEDLIAERLPKFHRRIRDFYDKYGYPVSRHITTPTRADIVYLLMKPLEYIFLAVLYMFDTQPENRIAVQYSEYKR
ncbi:MAG: hypothetical protein K2K14_08340 [Ruminococcus sp.]|nr:hypothetical protein [Ruminococcus sp.]